MGRKKVKLTSKNIYTLILSHIEEKRYVTHDELQKKFYYVADIDDVISQLQGTLDNGQWKDGLIYWTNIKRNNHNIATYALTVRGTEHLNSNRLNEVVKLQTYYNRVLAIATTFTAFLTLFLFFQSRENMRELVTYADGSINFLGILMAIILAGLLVYLIWLVFETIRKKDIS